MLRHISVLAESFVQRHGPSGCVRLCSHSAGPVSSDYIETGLLDTPVHDLPWRGKRVTKAQKKAAQANKRGPNRDLRIKRIPVPSEVDILQRGSRLYFSGPLGANAIDLQKIDTKGLGAFQVHPGEITVAGPSRELVGTVSSLIHDKIRGVVRGYLMYLQLVGVGYRVSKDRKAVSMRMQQNLSAS